MFDVNHNFIERMDFESFLIYVTVITQPLNSYHYDNRSIIR